MSDFNTNDQSQLSAGALLKRARESHGASLEALSSTIKVPVSKLRALESDDRVALPDPNFNRALAMTVCRALKVDAAPILAAMPAAVATVLAAAKPALNEPYRDFADTGLTFDRTSSVRVHLPKVPAAAWGPIGLLAVAALIYWLPAEWPSIAGFGSREPTAASPVTAAPASEEMPASSAPSPAMAPPVMPPPAASLPSSPSLAASANLQSNVAPVPASPSLVASAPLAPSLASKLSTGAAAPAPVASDILPPTLAGSAPSAAKPSKMRLSAKDSAWVEVRDGTGQKIFSRLIKAGESVELQGQAPLKVHAGNAPVLSLQFNGQAVDLAAVTRQNVARIELK